MKNKKARKIAIISGKGGVGKTTVAINLANTLNKDNEIILIDANITTPNIGLYLNILKPEKTLNHVIKEDIHPINALHHHESGIKLLLSDLRYDSIKNIDFRKFKSVISKLEEYADIILVDTAATLGSEVLNVIGAVDEVLIVINDDKASLIDALKTIATVKDMGIPILGAVLNKYNKKDTIKIEDFLGIPVIARIKNKKQIHRLNQNQKSYRILNKDFINLAGMLLGESYKIKLLKEYKSSIYHYVLKHIGLSR